MKCDEVQHWLLSAKSNAPSPAAVLRHQQGCRKCRRLARRLSRMDNKVRALPLPPASPEAKSRVLEKLEPRRLVIPPPHRAGAPRWVRVGKRVLAAAAAILLFFAGWYLGTSSFAPGTEHGLVVAKTKQQKQGIAKEPSILVLAVRRDIQLAEANEPTIQLAILSNLMQDLLAETLRLLRQGTLDEVPQLVSLYQIVVDNGVMGRAAKLPPEKKPAVFPAIVDKLRSAENKVKKITADSLPVVAELLEPIAVACRRASERLRGDRPIGNVKASNLPRLPSSTLAKLVYQGLKLTKEKNPMRRAELCSEMTPVLSRHIVVLAANGDAGQAYLLGESLNALIQKGIEQNLKRARDNGDEDDRREERVRKRINSALASLEKNMACAESSASLGMKRALQAIRAKQPNGVKAKDERNEAEVKEKRKSEEKGRRKGRSKKHPILPPGLLKKRLKKGAGWQHKNSPRQVAKLSFFANAYTQSNTHAPLSGDWTQLCAATGERDAGHELLVAAASSRRSMQCVKLLGGWKPPLRGLNDLRTCPRRTA